MRPILSGPLLLLLLGSCSQIREPAPNVLLVVVDTLRQDHLGTYGYEGNPTSPFLDSLASQSVVVEGLTASSSWTLPSMATLFTGLEPADHGVMRLAGEGFALPEVETLASKFRDAGYATGCVMGNFLMTRRRGGGFDRGFSWWDDSVVNLADPHRGSSASAVVASAENWLEAQGLERPWFLVLHFFDPHASYENHGDLDFGDPSYKGWVKGGLPVGEVRKQVAASTAEDLLQLSALYDEEIRAVDQALGGFMGQVRGRKDWGRTLVVITADHGEELGERGWVGHTRTLHAEQVDLPLLMRLPGGKRGGTRARARLPESGLHFTLLDLCGIPFPAGPDSSFASVLKGDQAPSSPVFFEVDFQPVLKAGADKNVRKRGVIEKNFKLVQDLATGDTFLFDLGEDPRENTNLAGSPERAGIQARLEALMAGNRWWAGK